MTTATLERVRCWAPISLAESVDLEDGSVEVWHKVLSYGKQVQRDERGRQRTWDVTPERAREMVANCERDAGTDFESPAFIGHPDERDKEPAVGWVRELKAGDDALYARVRYLAHMAAGIRRGEWRYVSPTFTFQFEDQHGVPRGAKLLDIGVLNTPHQKDLGGIPLAEAAFQLSEVAACDPGASIPDNNRAGEPHMSMTKEEFAAALSAALAEFEQKQDEKWNAKFAAFTDSLTPKKTEGEPTAMSEDVETRILAQLGEMRRKVDGAEAAIAKATNDAAKATTDAAAAREEADSYKATLGEARVNGLIKDGIDNGTLEVRDVPGFGTAEFKALDWLASSKFNGERGLRVHVTTASPVVAFADRRKSMPTAGTQAGVASLADIPFDKSLFKDRAEFEKFASASPSGGDPRFAQG